MRNFLAVLLLALSLWFGGALPAAAQDGVPVTVYWHMADDADVYLNGKPLRDYYPSFRDRGDEAPRPAFSTRTFLRDGDVFTVGGRRGGSFGFMLIAVDDSGRPVFTSNDRDWSVYYPEDRRDWPMLGQNSHRRPVTVQPNPWPPQQDLNRRFGNPALSIWADPSDRFAFLCGVVSLGGGNWGQAADPGGEASYDVAPETLGVVVSSYPELAPIPGYPVYYAPSMNSNYFFYDGMFWLFQRDQWYASSWFNGPWGRIQPELVPAYILRVPVSYYRYPSPYFARWDRNAPPRWGEHYGPAWEQRQRGWDRWDRHEYLRPAPLPDYQRGYAGNRYPRGEQQHALHTQNYHYEPTSPVARQHFQQNQPPPSRPGAAAPFQRPAAAPQQPPPGFQRPGFGQPAPNLQRPGQTPTPSAPHGAPPAAPAQKAAPAAAPAKKPAKDEHKKE